MRLTWSIVSGASTYNVYRNGTYIVNIAPTSTGSGEVSDYGVATGTTYSYTVAAVGSSGVVSPQSSAVSVTTPVPVVLTITSPNGGESLNTGSNHTITWTSSGGTTPTVNLELYKSGSSITSIIYGTPNTGSYAWTIPTNLSTASDYKIRISEAYNYNNFDQSDSDFTISVPLSPPSSPPIGFWKFDGNGTNDVSSASTSTTAVLVGGGAAFQTTGGKSGGYLYLSGSSDYAKIPYNSIFDLSAFTIEFWFRQRSNQSFNQNFVYKGIPTNNYNFYVLRYLWDEYNSGPIVAGSTAAGTGYWHQASNGNNLAHNEWHHVAYTRSTADIAYYLDGVPVYANSLSSDYTGAPKMPAVDIIVGNPAPDTDIDNLRIYNYVLTRNEVLYNMQNGLSSSKSLSSQLADLSTAALKIAEEIKKLLSR